MVVFDAVVELAPGGGDGAAGPAAGAVSALGVGADVGAGGVGVYLVGFKSADEGVVYRGVVEVYPSGTGVKDGPGRECPILCVRGLGLQVVRESVGVSHG